MNQETLFLAQIAAHVEEMLDEKMPHARSVDEQAIRSLLSMAPVRKVLDDPANAVYLPVRRHKRG